MQGKNIPTRQIWYLNFKKCQRVFNDFNSKIKIFKSFKA